MAAEIKFVKPEHVEILNEYLSAQGVALIFPEVQKAAKEKGLKDGDDVDYDFGGEADVWVEKVHSTQHYILLNEDE